MCSQLRPTRRLRVTQPWAASIPWLLDLNLLAELPGYFAAVHPRHLHIEQHQVGLEEAGRFQRTARIVDLAHFEHTVAFKCETHHAGGSGFVVNDENTFGCLGVHGKLVAEGAWWQKDENSS